MTFSKSLLETTTIKTVNFFQTEAKCFTIAKSRTPLLLHRRVTEQQVYMFQDSLMMGKVIIKRYSKALIKNRHNSILSSR